MTTIEQLYSLGARQNEILRRLKAGSLDIEKVLNATQGILDGVYPIETVTNSSFPWYEKSPSEQLDAIKYLNGVRGWGFTDADFPSVPEDLTLKPNEVLSLAVYLPDKGRQKGLQRTVEELWAATSEKIGEFAKWRRPEFKTDAKHLRLVRGSWKPGIRWVVIDLAVFAGKLPEYALENTSKDAEYQPAGIELLALLLLQPKWATSWDGKKFFYPNLTGLQFNWDSTEQSWSGVPCLHRWDGGRRFWLSAGWAVYGGDGFASPCFREC